MPDTEVQEAVDQSVQEPVDPNADLREELEAARQKLADVKANAQLSAKEREDDATRQKLLRELEAVQADIAYEEQAAALMARAQGTEETVAVEEAPAEKQVAPAAPARPTAQAPTPPTTPAPASAQAPADKGE